MEVSRYEYQDLKNQLNRIEILLAAVVDRSVQPPESSMVLSTKDVAELTGWSVGHIQKLCQAGRLPHIPSSPKKFMRRNLLEALDMMQIGGGTGRRKPRKMKRKA